MNNEDIKQILNMLIVKNSLEEMSDTSFEGKSIIEDLGFDSVSLIQLVTEIEETFGVDMDESGSLLELLDSYDELVDYLTERKGVYQLQ